MLQDMMTSTNFYTCKRDENETLNNARFCDLYDTRSLG